MFIDQQILMHLGVSVCDTILTNLIPIDCSSASQCLSVCECNLICRASPVGRRACLHKSAGWHKRDSHRAEWDVLATEDRRDQFLATHNSYL